MLDSKTQNAMQIDDAFMPNYEIDMVWLVCDLQHDKPDDVDGAILIKFQN